MKTNIRKTLEEIEKKYLSPFAKQSSESSGRVKAEKLCDLRPVFQHDRDRIIHSKSFRRLMHKTQVLLSPEGDHYRTRLTHVLEVSQIARTIAKSLKLNESLVEAISLAHDLGHTPFGHSGEETLNQIHKNGFSHVKQSLRVVDILEKEGKGLNLTEEVRDGIINHSKGETGQIINNKTGKTLEARIVRVSDIIAYINHDIDDAIRAGIICEKELPKNCTKILGNSHGKRIERMVKDIILETINHNDGALYITDKVQDTIYELREFLFKNVYKSENLQKIKQKAKRVVSELYKYYQENPQRFEKDTVSFRKGKDKFEQRILDFIAGMTDRYALDKYEELFIPRQWKVY